MRVRHAVVPFAVMVLVSGLGGAGPSSAAAQELAAEPGPLERQAHQVGAEHPIPTRIYTQQALYPTGGFADGVRATVVVRMTLTAWGAVGEVRPVSGAVASGGGALRDSFVRTAVDASRLWFYEPPVDGPITFDVVFTFTPDADFASISQRAAAPPAPPRDPRPPVEPQRPGDPVRVGGDLQQPVRTWYVPPQYPEDARAERISGIVILEAIIDTSGRVRDARVIRSVPGLDHAALEAVRQWQYWPAHLNGRPIPLIMTATVRFQLQQ